MTKEEFHRLAAETCSDWLYELIMNETGDPDLAHIVARAANAISWHDMMKYAYQNTRVSAGKFSNNTYIDAPDGIYNKLKEII